ncbi:WD40 repeat-like protein [Basidiobolus meristosporus CBS 931.73]|uniref:WD40 repeat-like protein n=1 Tax=Basidiobolus meristosporus CBS 931.73 TaxID=1314790 RepID=A0A1Y1YJM2_9FUNG|nr:WD40 repeat-like protein [Basidiobolus meristosporus CBS 931.73]|eukprot:ORX98168.1 WD40 repeat-like protein [Basidiobolus meristosporus CBS 931.73]
MNDRDVDTGLIPKSLFSTTTLKPKGLTNVNGESSNVKRGGNFYATDHGNSTISSEMHHNPYDNYSRKRHKSVGPTDQETVGGKSWTPSKYITSDSSSDESSTSESDSEEAELSALSFNALKSQKEMHELLLKLERTRSKHARYLEKAKSEAKKIQKISRKLQQKFHSVCDQVNTWSRNIQASGAGNNSNPSNKVSPPRASSSRLPSNSHPVQSPPLLQHPLDSLVVSSPTKYRPTPKEEAEYDINSEMLDVISRTRTDMRTKAFTRKPRSLIYQTVKDYEGNQMECLVTSSLDGEIQFWSPTMRKIVTRVTKQTLKKPWAEDICFVHPSIVAVASAKKDGELLENQLSFVHVLKANTSQISYRVQHSNSKPHSDRGVSALCPIVSNDKEFMFSTCGSDKMVHLWKYKTPQNSGEDAEQTGLLLAHSRHTSAVHALCYEPEKRVLYSGGADCKFYGYSLETKNIVTEYKYPERVNHVITHPTNPDLLLVCLSGKNDQLHIYDRRSNNFSSLNFGFQQSDNLSRYMSPSFHPNGHLVAFGQNEPKINIWDVRYIQQGRKSSQVLYLHERRILKSLFHPHQDTLISMSTDSSLAFTDFHMFENTVVV